VTDPTIQALVLAAGRSTRLAREIDGGSKVLVDVGGETVLEHNLRWLAASGITSVWINLHHRAHAVQRVAGDGHRLGLYVQYCEEPELFGTAGTFRALAAHWTGTVLVVYGDNVSNFWLSSLLHHHRESSAIATVALFDTRVHAHSGIAGGRVAIRDDRVQTFVEGGASEAPFVNAGVYALERKVLDYVPTTSAPDFGKDVFPALIAAGRHPIAHVIEPDGYCFGIDTPEALRRTRVALAARASSTC
jgi:NDP-sugar pyrophosphorylase family protein